MGEDEYLGMRYKHDWARLQLIIFVCLGVVLVLSQYLNLYLLEIVTGLGMVTLMLSFFYVAVNTGLLKANNKDRGRKKRKHRYDELDT